MKRANENLYCSVISGGVSMNTKQKIIRSALSLFEEKGFHKVSVREISEKASVSNGGFYHHFKSKDELLYQINASILTHVIENSKKAAMKNNSPIEKLAGMIRVFIHTFDIYHQEVTVMYRDNHYLAPDFFIKIKETRNEYQKYIFNIIQEGINEGEIRKNIPIILSGMAIFGLINWTYQWYEKNRSLSIEDIATIYIDFIFNALLTKEAKSNPNYHHFFIDENSEFYQVNNLSLEKFSLI